MLQLQSSPLSFTHSELVKRMSVHRGVYCQRGLLRPSLSTVYHCCPAEVRSTSSRQHACTYLCSLYARVADGEL